MGDIEILKRRIAANKGVIPYDIIFENVNVVDVFTESIRRMNVAIVDGVICALNPNNMNAREVIDCSGDYMAPGFLDAHMHIETSHLNPVSWAEATIPHGTTTIFFDAMMSASVYGASYQNTLQNMIDQIPTRVYYQIPSRIPGKIDLETIGGILDSATVAELLNNPKSVSLGEVNYSAVLEQDDEILKKIAYALDKNKKINGHCPECATEDLNTVAAVGITDDHESMKYQELYEKLSRGMTVMVREGSIEPNVEALIEGVVHNNLPTDNLIFCTDDKHPIDLVEKGHIDYAVNKAISCGLDPIKAIKMATYNTARYFGVSDKIGSVTPGRCADLILFDSLDKIILKRVYVGGQLVAQDGKILYETNSCDTYADHSIKITGTIGENTFKIASEGLAAKFNVMKIKENNLCPEAVIRELKIVDGYAVPDVINDILPISVVERYGHNGNIGNAFIEGLGIKKGAIASSMASEGNNIVVCGVSYSDMVTAVYELEKMDGGMVIVCNGQIIERSAMRIGGIMYDMDIENVINTMTSIRSKLSEIGCDNPLAFTYMGVATAPSIPSFGLTDKGLIDVQQQKIISVKI